MCGVFIGVFYSKFLTALEAFSNCKSVTKQAVGRKTGRIAFNGCCPTQEQCEYRCRQNVVFMLSFFPKERKAANTVPRPCPTIWQPSLEHAFKQVGAKTIVAWDRAKSQSFWWGGIYRSKPPFPSLGTCVSLNYQSRTISTTVVAAACRKGATTSKSLPRVQSESPCYLLSRALGRTNERGAYSETSQLVYNRVMMAIIILSVWAWIPLARVIQILTGTGTRQDPVIGSHRIGVGL